MLIYAMQRLGLGVLVMVAVSMIVFALTNVAVDPAHAIAGESASAADIETIRQVYGLDRPVLARYASWLGAAVRGDLGFSHRHKRPVVDVLRQHVPVTLTLGVASLLFALALALPLGILGALRSNTWIDRLVLALAVVGQAMPTFWLALVGIVIFSVGLGWLPVSGSEGWRSFVLPAVALGYYAMPPLMRLTRAGMLEVLEADYIRTARAKGLTQPAVVVKHALRNAILPVVSLTAVQLGFMLGGSVVIETVFAMRGLGYLAWESISLADLPVVQAIVLTIAVIYVVLTLLADIMNVWLDPRMRTA